MYTVARKGRRPSVSTQQSAVLENTFCKFAKATKMSARKYLVFKTPIWFGKSTIRGFGTTAVFKSNAQPFENIPGPPGNGLPFIGHMNLYMKKPAGLGKSWENLRNIKEKHLKHDEKLLRLNLPPFNPGNGGRVLVLLDPNDVGHILRHEGKYPNRGSGFEVFKMMRESRKDIYHETTGLLMEDGEKWHDMRSKVQQDLMRPKSAHFYIDDIRKVSEEFMGFIKRQKSKDDNTIKNFLPELFRYSFESVSLIALDTRLGCFNDPMDPEIAKTHKAFNDMLGEL